jgi:hypothetical protein
MGVNEGEEVGMVSSCMPKTCRWSFVGFNDDEIDSNLMPATPVNSDHRVLVQDDQSQEEHSHFMHMSVPKIGIGMDSSITPLRHGGLSLVQTTDFFYPIVEDPYMQGNERPPHCLHIF